MEYGDWVLKVDRLRGGEPVRTYSADQMRRAFERGTSPSEFIAEATPLPKSWSDEPWDRDNTWSLQLENRLGVLGWLYLFGNAAVLGVWLWWLVANRNNRAEILPTWLLGATAVGAIAGMILGYGLLNLRRWARGLTWFFAGVAVLDFMQSVVNVLSGMLPWPYLAEPALSTLLVCVTLYLLCDPHADALLT